MTLFDRLKKALHEDNSITCTKEELKGKAGYTTEYLLSLGLSKLDLKKLERKGLAIRGYTEKAHKTSLGRTKSHREVRWLVVDKGEAKDGRTQE